MTNPLATTIRFANATRGEGQLQLKPRATIGLRVGRAFALGGSRRVEVTADVLNMLNQRCRPDFLGGANQQFSTNYGLDPSRDATAGARALRFVF